MGTFLIFRQELLIPGFHPFYHLISGHLPRCHPAQQRAYI